MSGRVAAAVGTAVDGVEAEHAGRVRELLRTESEARRQLEAECSRLASELGSAQAARQAAQDAAAVGPFSNHTLFFFACIFQF